MSARYLHCNDINMLIDAWRDDFEYRAAISIELSKKGDGREYTENRQRMIECATMYLGLKELKKELY